MKISYFWDINAKDILLTSMSQDNQKRSDEHSHMHGTHVNLLLNLLKTQ